MNVSELIHAILEGYSLPWNGFHGVAHWGRVLENGERLAEAVGANSEIVRLFALFHDSRRFNEWFDPAHGRRGAELAKQFRGRYFALSDAEFELLDFACKWHTDEVHHDDTTIQCCWDADRLDLGRVGMFPDRKFLNTDFAKSPDLNRWAHGRASMDFLPDSVREVCAKLSRLDGCLK